MYWDWGGGRGARGLDRGREEGWACSRAGVEEGDLWEGRVQALTKRRLLPSAVEEEHDGRSRGHLVPRVTIPTKD